MEILSVKIALKLKEIELIHYTLGWALNSDKALEPWERELASRIRGDLETSIAGGGK